MKEIIESLQTKSNTDFLLDTCFLIYEFQEGNQKKLEKFCKEHDVGMSSFNLLELDHVSKKLSGPLTHHLRSFLKKNIISKIDTPVMPGDRTGEHKYVSNFDSKILDLIPDPSDAVLFVLAAKINANILTRDRHHIFTAVAENYSNTFQILNKLPKE